MSLTEKQKADLSDALIEARDAVKAITNPADQYPGITVEEAYDVQISTLRTRVKNGDPVVGHKTGLCVRSAQKEFNLSGPICGHFHASMVVSEGEPIPMSRLVRAFVEGEMAFVLEKDIKGPGVTLAKVMASIAGVLPAFEIADTHLKNDPRNAQDIIAENAAASLVVLGGQFTRIDGIDLRQVGCVLEKDGEVVASSTAINVLSNPVQPIVYLANKLAEYDMGLSAGEFVISGTPLPALSPQAGSCYRATFDRFGHISVRFTT